jgi:uncharacterized protein YccT (UPF0319 family)
MKLKAIAISSLLLSLNSHADVTLNLPDNFRLLAVNEQDAAKGWDNLFKSSDDAITLKNGENQIIYQIDKYFYRGDTQSVRYRSNPYIVTFTASDKTLNLTLPNFSDETHARAFKSDDLSLQDSNEQLVVFKHDQLKLDGFSVSHDYHDYAKRYNAQHGEAALTTSTAAAMVTKEKTTSSTVNPTESNQSVSDQASEQLKHWFLQADEKTKKEFLSWAVSNL